MCIKSILETAAIKQKQNKQKGSKETSVLMKGKNNILVISKGQGQASPLFSYICIIDVVKHRQSPK